MKRAANFAALSKLVLLPRGEYPQVSRPGYSFLRDLDPFGCPILAL